MKILIICYVYPPEIAPAATMVQELAQDLAGLGHEVTVQTGWPNHPEGKLFPGWRTRWRQTSGEGPAGVRVQRVAHAIYPKDNPLLRLWNYATFAASSFLNGVTLGRHDAVVSLSTPLFGVVTAGLLAKAWRGRFINIVFDLWPEAIVNAGMMGKNLFYHVSRAIDTANLRTSDEITCLGEGMRRLILDRRIDGRKVHVVPFWIDTDEIQPLERDNAWRAEQGIAPDKFVALFAGTIGYASGAQILADTAAALADREDVQLLVVGQGVVKDELMELARQRGLGNMKFLPFQPRERLAEMQSAADVGLVTLLPDAGFSSVPSKILGYMAAGRAVIASAPEGTDTAQLVANGGFGVVTPSQDPKALAEAIASLADDRARCAKLGQAARDYAVQHYSRQAVVRQYAELITGTS